MNTIVAITDKPATRSTILFALFPSRRLFHGLLLISGAFLAATVSLYWLIWIFPMDYSSRPLTVQREASFARDVIRNHYLGGVCLCYLPGDVCY